MTAPGPTGDGQRTDPTQPKSWRNDGVGVLHDAYAQFRTFERTRDGRMVAGVCAGVGRRLGIDPVVIRVVIAVLALVSGAGLVLYGAGWLLLPERGSDRSIVDRMLGRQGSEPNGAIVVGVGVIVALVAMSMIPWGEDWWGPVLVAGIIAGLVALARRRPDESSTDPLTYLGGPGDTTAASAPGMAGMAAEQPPTSRGYEPPQPTTPTTSTTPAGPVAAATQSDLSDLSDPVDPADPMDPANAPTTDDPAEPTRPAGITAGVAPRTWTQHAATPPPPSFWDQPDPLGLESEPAPAGYASTIPAPPPETPVRRPRSFLFPITVGAALLSLFILAAASGAGERIPLLFWAAAPLGVIGLGLLAGTWYGRSGGLIALGIPLAIALVPLGVVDAVAQPGYWPDGDASIGDQRYEPATVAEIEPIYRHGAGEFTLDLSEVKFADRDTVDVSVESGLGEVSVIVPDDVDVQVSGSVGLGDAELFGDSVLDNPTPRLNLLDEGTDGTGGGRLNLEVDHGMGNLEVVRASAAQTAGVSGPDAPNGPHPPHPPRVEEPEEPR